jgi:hypothetical protein
MKRLIIATAILAALTSATPALASRPNPDKRAGTRVCIKTSPAPWPWGTWRCYTR